MKMFLLPVFALVFALALGEKASATTCEPGLKREWTMPRELRVSTELLDFAMSSEKFAALMNSVAKAFAVLNDPERIKALPSYRVVAEDSAEKFASELAETSVMRDNPQLLMPSLYIYAKVRASELRESLEPDEAAVLAVLLRNIFPDRPRFKEIFTPRPNNLEDFQKLKKLLYDRCKPILARPEYRRALEDLVSNAAARTMIERTGIFADTTDRYFQKLIVGLRKGQLDQDQVMLSQKIFAAVIYESIPAQFAMSSSGSPTYAEEEQFLLNYMAKDLGVMSNIEDIMTVSRLLVSGEDVDKTPHEIWQSAIANAKDLLLPVKHEFALAQTERQKNKIPAPVQVLPYTLKLVDHLEPKSSVSIREARVLVTSSQVVTPAQNLSDQIRPENSLRTFTSYVARPRSLLQLEPNRSYEFWFLRDREPRLESVRFGQSVLDWMTDHPVEAQNFINALHMGRARDNGQAGIKLMNARYAVRDLAAFELKIQGSFRGSLLYGEDGWQFINVVHKNDQDRLLRHLTPLPESSAD